MGKAKLLVQLLHCNSVHKNNSHSSSVNHGRFGSQELPQIIKKDVSICRVCLKDGKIPIFRSGAPDISVSLKTIAGVDVSPDDPYPHFLCKPCNMLLLDAIIFRETALKSDLLLKNAENHERDCVQEMDNSFDYEDLKDKKTKSFKNDENKIHSQNQYGKSTNSIKYDKTTHTMMSSEDKNLYHKKLKVKRKWQYCNICNISFNSFEEYKSHRMSEDHQNMRYKCTICNKTYTNSYYKRHLLIHKGEAPYMCDLCGKSFVHKAPFDRHRFTHFNELPYQCSLCPYKGRFQESLKMHMRSHTGEKPYQCTQCAARFIHKSNLNAHSKRHNRQRDFKCDPCNQAFYSKMELNLHQKVVHTGIKEHACNICGITFGYRKQLRHHELTVHKRAKQKSGRMPLYLKLDKMVQEDNITGNS